MTRRDARAVVLAAAAALCAGGTSTRPAHSVVIESVAFQPRTLSVHRGERVQWVNRDPFPHTVTSDAGRFDSHDIAPGATWSYRPEAPGTYSYRCTLHPGMTGTLLVK